MRRIVIISVLSLMIAVPAVSIATPIDPGPYFTGFAGATFPRSVDVTGVDVGVPVNDHVRFHPGYYVGGAFGFDFGLLRLEGEVSYKDSELKSVNASGVPFSSVDGDVSALGFMGNLWFDIHNPTPITPYIGGGAGVAVLDLNNTSAFNPATGSPLIPLYPDDRDTVFAYQGGACLDIAMTRHVSLDVGYRYFGTEKGHFNDGPLSANMKFESHNALLGIKVKF